MSEQETKKTKGVVDIVFLMDATGSMSDCIDALKDNVSTFVDSMCESAQDNPVRDWRAKVVGYRDFIDDASSALEDNPFVTEPEAVKTQLRALEAREGGDEQMALPESRNPGRYYFHRCLIPSDHQGRWHPG